MTPSSDALSGPDDALEPDGFTVTADDGARIHFLDWGGPAAGAGPVTTVVTLHGLAQTAWIWAPVGRRVGGPSGRIHLATPDLRGHGLSDAPTEDGAYDLEILAADAIAVAEGAASGPLGDARLILAGHGFGAIVAAGAAARLGDGCAGLVLIDGGWESMENATGLDVEEFLRGLEEPPEVMRSLDAFLADRRAFDPGTWDDDQERAARATIVETHAGRVVPATRPHALDACVRTMFAYDPLATLATVGAPVVALIAADDETGSRSRAVEAASAARIAAGHPPIRLVSLRPVGHNLMRYRPTEVAAAILSI